MKRWNLVIVLLVLLNLLSTLFLVCLLWDQADERSAKEMEKLRADIFLKDLYTRQNISESITNDFSQINNLTLTNLSYQHPVLVCRYSQFGCAQCVDFAIDNIKEQFPEYNVDPRIMFVASEYRDKTRTDFINNINLANESLGLKFEQTRIPFYFLISEGKIKHFFIPDAIAPEYTKTYLDEIKKNYFK